eukprot:2678615-Prymnesium_polylepis.1
MGGALEARARHLLHGNPYGAWARNEVRCTICGPSRCLIVAMPMCRRRRAQPPHDVCSRAWHGGSPGKAGGS